MNLLMRILDALRFGVAVLRHLGGQIGEPAPSSPLTKEEVEKVLAAGLVDCPEATNYDTSIVDLLKVLKIDSTAGHRKQMARELGYDGSFEDSAAMNVWLHAEVMKRVAEHYPRPANA